MEKRIREREDFKKQFDLMMAEKAEREAQRREEEEKYREHLLSVMAEKDKLDQMNAQKARLKREEHKREASRLLEERKKEQERMKQLELEEREEQRKLQEFKRKIIEEERIRLLKEHAGR